MPHIPVDKIPRLIERKLIPDISDRRLARLREKVRPIRHVTEDGSMRPVLVKPSCATTQAITWAEETEELPGVLLVRLGTIVTFHECAAPSLFKPSEAEVLAQIPSFWLVDVDYYEFIDSGDLDRRNFFEEPGGNTYHVTRVQLWADVSRHVIPDPDPEPEPKAGGPCSVCGGTTEDIYGGPCMACWSKV